MIKPVKDKDSMYMAQALAQARKAAVADEVPIGAVIVNPHGTIIARGYNKVEATNCQLAHAELEALRKACKKIDDWRLLDHWLYVTLEPCSMCMYAIIQSRMAGIVYGADSPIFGFHLDNQDNLAVYKKTTIIKGIGAQESSALLKDFFNKKRKTQRD